jgi:hypothetical protein
VAAHGPKRQAKSRGYRARGGTLSNPFDIGSTKKNSILERVMLFKSCLAGLAIAVSLAAQSAQAGNCPAKSTRFEDIVVALNKAPSCLNAMQVLEACRYEDSGGLSGDPELCRRASGPVLDACEYVASRVVELNAIVEKKCKAEAPQSTQREECPAKSTMMDDVTVALDEAPSCDRAMKVFEACEYGTSGDIHFGAVVEKKCERDFLARLNEPQKKAYQREMRACDRKYQNQSGTMYRSFTAFCRAEVAQRYSRRALKAANASRAR